MIRGSAGCFGIYPTKPKLRQIEFFDEDIDHANRIVLADPVFQAFRKQRGLTAIDPLNERAPPIFLDRHENLIAGIETGDAFLHRLVRDKSTELFQACTRQVPFTPDF